MHSIINSKDVLYLLINYETAVNSLHLSITKHLSYFTRIFRTLFGTLFDIIDSTSNGLVSKVTSC